VCVCVWVCVCVCGCVCVGVRVRARAHARHTPLSRAAFTLAHAKRPVVWPNRSFMRQLIAYELLLQEKGVLAGKGATIEMSEWDGWTQGVVASSMQQVRMMWRVSCGV
jgi:hypothetical protein